MDDVWKDISLSSLYNPSTNPITVTTTTHSSPFHHGVILQDFFGGAAPHFAPPPATDLSLKNSEPNSKNWSKSHLGSCASGLTSLSSSFNSPFNALNSSSVVPLFPSSAAASSSSSLTVKRHAPEYSEKDKRLMKSREAAARSRARKQARAEDLELEVERLLKENAKLKSQQREICIATADQHPEKPKLSRSLTAPF